MDLTELENHPAKAKRAYPENVIAPLTKTSDLLGHSPYIGTHVPPYCSSNWINIFYLHTSTAFLSDSICNVYIKHLLTPLRNIKQLTLLVKWIGSYNQEVFRYSQTQHEIRNQNKLQTQFKSIHKEKSTFWIFFVE